METPEKTKRQPWKFHRTVLYLLEILRPMEIPRPKAKAHGDSTRFFLNNFWKFVFFFNWPLKFPHTFFSGLLCIIRSNWKFLRKQVLEGCFKWSHIRFLFLFFFFFFFLIRLSNSSSRVYMSEWLPLKAGVPQGIDIGPLFFQSISMTYQLKYYPLLSCLQMIHN